MPTIAGWSLLAIASAVTVVLGVAILVDYALRRGLVHRELDGTTGPETDPRTVEPHPGPPGRRAGDVRTEGVIGTLLLLVGLGLGLVTLIGGWSGAGSSVSGGPGVAPTDCAQSWAGCPQATPLP
jgi:hypothetical protein